MRRNIFWLWTLVALIVLLNLAVIPWFYSTAPAGSCFNGDKSGLLYCLYARMLSGMSVSGLSRQEVILLSLLTIDYILFIVIIFLLGRHTRKKIRHYIGTKKQRSADSK